LAATDSRVSVEGEKDAVKLLAESVSS